MLAISFAIGALIRKHYFVQRQSEMVGLGVHSVQTVLAAGEEQSQSSFLGIAKGAEKLPIKINHQGLGLIQAWLRDERDLKAGGL
jgi:hypothetical protein